MPKYRIECTIAGTTTITRNADGKSCLLQGDDSDAFERRLGQTNDKYTDDDLCAEYDSIMQ